MANEYVNKVTLGNEVLLDLTSDTVTAGDVAAGKSLHLRSGEPATGTLQLGAMPYGECDSTSTATVFTATVPGITELQDGTTMMLKNGVVTSAANFTININDLGAKPCYNNMATGNDTTPTAPTRDTTIFNINYTMLFVYSEDIVDGGGWICYRGYDGNTNTIGYQLRTNSSNLVAADTGYRYRIWLTSADDKKWVPINTSTSTDATTTRALNTRAIDPFGEIVYRATNGTCNSGAGLGATGIWQQYTLTIGYSYVKTLTYPAPVYLKCTPQTDGSAKMADIVQAFPSSNDGKIYIFLGIAYSATAMELHAEHPVYWHDGTGIRIWTGAASSGSSVDPATATPLMDGTAAVGTSDKYAREDHVHPTDTSRQATLVSGTNIKTVNGSSILGSGDLTISGGSTTTWYGTSATIATAAAKVVTCENFTLVKGAIISVLFTYANTAATPTLNVNSTGVKDIYVGNGTVNSTTNVLKWLAFTQITFMYDGTRFRYLCATAAASVAPSRGACSWYGTSSTTAATAAKTSMINNFVLTQGAVAYITFTTANTYVSGEITLNVNSTGAKTIYVNNAATSSSNTLTWEAGETLTFVYSGSYYYFVGRTKPVEVVQTLTSGEQIGTVNGTALYAPSGGSGGVSVTTTTVTIAASNWSNNTCTKSVTGVTASNDVLVTYAPASKSAYTAADIYCTAQGAGTLTFGCTTTPTAIITVNVMIIDGGVSPDYAIQNNSTVVTVASSASVGSTVAVTGTGSGYVQAVTSGNVIVLDTTEIVSGQTITFTMPGEAVVVRDAFGTGTASGGSSTINFGNLYLPEGAKKITIMRTSGGN